MSSRQWRYVKSVIVCFFPNCREKIKTFLLSQELALGKNPHGRRWDRHSIRLCLTLWCRSPRDYGELMNSKFLILPSKKQLRNFKNSIKQDAGINKDILHWMSNEVKVKNVSPEGLEGGLQLMKCQFNQICNLR